MKRKSGKTEQGPDGPKPALGNAVGDGTYLHPYFKKYLGYCFFKSAASFRARLDRLLEPYGLVAPQFGILSILQIQGSITQSELGLYMAMDKATIVRMIDILENKKLVTRVPSKKDRREKHLEITKAGRQAVIELDELRKRAEKEFLSPLTATEREQLGVIVGKLISSVNFKS